MPGDPLAAHMVLPPQFLLHLRTVLVATAGGAVAVLLHIPLPWMIGAMMAAAGLTWFGDVPNPPVVRPASLIVLGLGLGQSFSGPVLAAVAGAVPAMVAAGVVTILSALLIARLFARMAGTDARTAYFCTVPGGIVLMAVLAQRAGASVPAVTLSQTLRMCLVVLLFPPFIAAVAPAVADAAFSTPQLPADPLGLVLLLAGGLLVGMATTRLGVANPWMIGPCLAVIPLSAMGWLPSGVPIWLVDAAQVGMGATLGLRLTPRFLMSSRKLAVVSIVSTAALSVLLAVLAVPLGWVADLPVAAVVLGMAPGGMPEMAVTAKAMDLAVPLVLGFHLVRVLLCNMLIGPIWRLAVASGVIR
jgi:membrane AbrB-like protein